jgi:hypothetical protein
VEIIEQNPKLMAILEIFSECNQESVNWGLSASCCYLGPLSMQLQENSIR